MSARANPQVVFPARAGVSLSGDHLGAVIDRFPRPRGDEPPRELMRYLIRLFSPPARG